MQPPRNRFATGASARRKITKMVKRVARLRQTFWRDTVESVKVRARVGGYLEKVNFKEGQFVKKGDLLFVIDPRTFEAELASAKSRLA